MQSRARRRFGPEEASEPFSVVAIGEETGNHSRREDYVEKPKYPPPSGSSWLPSIPQKFLSSVNNFGGAFSGNQPKQLDHLIRPPVERNPPHFDDEDDKENEPEFIMASRDRSTEFANAIRSLQGRNIQRAVNVRDPRKAKQLQSYSEFTMIAKHIGKNIASTYAKLEKLTLCECLC